jgi:hypothetical protein
MLDAVLSADGNYVGDDFITGANGSHIADCQAMGLPDVNYNSIYSIVVMSGIDAVSEVVNFTVDPSGSTYIESGGNMAGTGQGKLFSARVRLQEPNGRKYTLEGNGSTSADAVAELSAKLALVDARVTTISGVRIAGALGGQDLTDFNGVNAARVTDAGGYNNVDVTLRQVFNAGTATQVIEEPTIRVENAINGIASAAIDGMVDPTNAKVAALAAAYSDGDGNKGYAAYKGRFVR